MGIQLNDVYVTKTEGANKLSYIIPTYMDGMLFKAYLELNNNKLKEILNEK